MRTIGWIVAVTGLGVGASASAQSCQSLGWSPEFYSPLPWGFSAEGTAVPLAVDRLSPSERLIIGHGYTGGPASQAGVVAWDGQSASIFATVGAGQVAAAVVFDADGQGPGMPRLVVAGSFAFIGGTNISRVAAWDGQAWQPMGQFDGTIACLTVFPETGSGPPVLYAGGTSGTGNVARWTGAQWQPMPAGSSGGAVSALTVFDSGSGPELYAGGSFVLPGGSRSVARWNGAAWQPLGTLLWNNAVPTISSLVVHDPDGAGPQPSLLYLGGSHAGTAQVNSPGVMAWNGTAFLPVGGGVQKEDLLWSCRLASYDRDGAGPAPAVLCATGNFTSAGGVAVRNAAQWDGASWQPMGAGLDVSRPTPVVVDFDGAGPGNPKLFAGDCRWSGTVPLNGLAQWDGETWSAVGPTWLPGAGQGVAGGVSELLVLPTSAQHEVMVAAGSFNQAGGITAAGVAAWDGLGWSALAPEIVTARAAAVFDDDGPGPGRPAAWIGGGFDQLGGIPSRGLCAWDGQGWAATGVGLNSGGVIQAMAVSEGGVPALVVCGTFTSIDGVPASRVAVRSGGLWSGLGSPPLTNPTLLTTWDPDGPGPLGATVVIGAASGGLYRWDGAAWQPIAAPPVSPQAIASFDLDGAGAGAPALIAGGFDQQTGTSGFFAWDGNAWARVGQAFDVPFGISRLKPLGTGSETRLHAAGTFRWGTSAASVIRWNGADWEMAAEGSGGLSCAYFRDDPGQPPALYVAADHFQTPAGTSRGVARLGCVGGVCYANCDGSAVVPLLNVLDFNCYLNRFSAGDAYANCDRSTAPPVLNVLDFNCFLNAFAAGCP